MIKRKNKMLVGVLSLLLVITVGYALFSETLQINGTASAQGKFDLTYECMNDVHVSIGEGKGECTPPNETKPNEVTLSSTLTKPNDGMIYAIKITNTGTIPVVLASVTSPNNILRANFDESGDQAFFNKQTSLLASYTIVKMTAEGDFGDENLYGDKAVADAQLTIQPGESLGIEVDHIWYNSANQPALPEGGATLNYNLTFEFVQQTAQ